MTEQKKMSLDETQVIAMEPKQKLHESRLRMDQAIQREVQDAMERKQFEVSAMLAKAGVPINEYPDTPEGATQLKKFMDEHDIQVQKLVYQDNFRMSGYYVSRAGLHIGMVPCEIVRGVMI